MITGAFGQLGTELTAALRQIHGMDNVLVTGRRLRAQGTLMEGPTAELDVTDGPAALELVRAHRIEVIYHLAARLSAVGEQQPQSAWRINMDGLHNVLEAARQGGVKRLFWPSSIAVFGPETPRDRVPQDTVMRPTTIYGVTKVAGELLCDYYVSKYGLDVRGVRYPGVISSQALPGGGTTDYAVEIFHQALQTGSYTCFVRQDTVLPMIYMPDCIKAAVQLMEADQQRLRHHNGFNVQAMSFSVAELAAEIAKHVPGFVWTADFDLGRMTRDMLEQLAGSRS
jgi:nucleoside-diphosphate-sugar epimerase